MFESISHITLIVTDLNKTTALFASIFQAKEVYNSGDRTFSLSRERFLSIGSLWVALMEGEPLQQRTYNHIAFKIPDSEYEEYENRIRSLNLDILPPRPRVEGEGRSIYFYDYDNHLFELHTGTLEERLTRYNQN